MAAKLGRYVFRKIGGRIVPIRVGAEAKTLAAGPKGQSAKIVKKLNTLLKSRQVKVGKKGALLKVPEADSTKSMINFMDKTGAVRVSNFGGYVNAHIARKLSDAQKTKLIEMSVGKRVAVDVSGAKKGFTSSGDFSSFGEAYRKVLLPSSKELKKENTRAIKKAIEELGTTSNPNEAGFIFRDGKMLDLSGKRIGGSANTRELDHREVAGIISERAKKVTARDTTDILRRAQYERKARAESLHMVTNNKKIIKKLWPERKEWRDVIRDFTKQIRRRKPKNK